MTDPPVLPTSAALFLDFDGTLAPLAPRPQDVRVPNWVVPTLGRWQRALAGAVAIISGRPIEQLDAFLSPLVVAAAGEHGAQRRDAAGRSQWSRAEFPPGVRERASEFAARHPGLLLEPKPSGFALHFRARPELGTAVHEMFVGALASAAGADAWELLNGHCVFELKQRAVSKGRALQAFLAEAPFAGRVPVFVGDDATDEDGIRAAQEAGGFGVRVGPGATQARFRLSDTDAVAHWLGAAGETLAPHAIGGAR
jgi:trehalose 6-phosphate phosphatase